MHEVIKPDGFPKPRGYSDGMLAQPGRLLFVAGEIGWDENEQLVDPGIAGQFGRALDNVLKVVTTAGGRAEHICRFTIYVTDKHEYIGAVKEIGEHYRERMGKHYPAMALVQVADLLMDGAKVEIEATAVIPERGADQ